MVESRRRSPGQQLTGLPEQQPSLAEAIKRATLTKKQRRARDVLAEMDFSDPKLPPDAAGIIFLYFAWKDAVSIVPVQRITGIANEADARFLVDRVGQSDELIRQYDIFFLRYKAKPSGGE